MARKVGGLCLRVGEVGGDNLSDPCVGDLERGVLPEEGDDGRAPGRSLHEALCGRRGGLVEECGAVACEHPALRPHAESCTVLELMVDEGGGKRGGRGEAPAPAGLDREGAAGRVGGVALAPGPVEEEPDRCLLCLEMDPRRGVLDEPAQVGSAEDACGDSLEEGGLSSAIPAGKDDPSAGRKREFQEGKGADVGERCPKDVHAGLPGQACTIAARCRGHSGRTTPVARWRISRGRQSYEGMYSIIIGVLSWNVGIFRWTEYLEYSMSAGSPSR